MGAISAIQWTDATANFWTGCKKVSEGCKFCYMYRDKERYGQNPTKVIQVKESTIRGILKKLKPGDKIFTCSWSDFFIEEADGWREWAWDIIRSHPQFIWQILTKRIERVPDCLPSDWGQGWPNVWLGVSVENNRSLHRINILDVIPARTKFVSFEPLLEDLYLFKIGQWALQGMDWAIIGGESGNENGKYRYRPMEISWVANILGYLAQAGVAAPFVKQLGTHLAKKMELKDRHGGDWAEWPQALRIRKFPETVKAL